MLIFDANSGLLHLRRAAMFVYVSCLYSYYNGVHLLIHRDGKGPSSQFFNSLLTRYFLFGSPEAHDTDVFVVRRTRCPVPPPSRMKRQRTVLNGDGTRVFICFCTARHPELASAGVSQNPFRGMGPLFCTARTRWGWSFLVTSWLAIAMRHSMSPQRVPPQNFLHSHSCSDVPLVEVSHSCVVTGDMGIMSPSHSCCCTNCVVCFNSIIQLKKL